MRKFFWCFFTSSNYKESASLNELIYRCIWLLDNCENVTVEIDYFHIVINTSSSKIEMWNANKFYAWLSNGKVNGRRYVDLGASASALYDFKKCLKRKGYNIYVKYTPMIDGEILIDDVKC